MKVFQTATHLLILGAAVLCFSPETALAITSPYVTIQADVPLNQSTNDSVNGVLPYFNSHTPIEGDIASLTDATSPSTPTGNVIMGPDNTWIGIAWDFGEPPAGKIWRLDRFDVWISGDDNLRKGYDADISYSSSGNVNEFTIIPNSRHEADMTQNSQYNYVRYDFPSEFIAGPSTDQDKYPVTGFRYLRLNSLGQRVNNTDWQTRFVEIDIWVTAIPSPDSPSISSVTRDNAGNVTLSWAAIPGRTYSVEYKAAVGDAGWTTLDTVVASSETESLIDPSTSGSERYYRVVLQP